MAFNLVRVTALLCGAAFAVPVALAQAPGKDGPKAAPYRCVGFDEPIRSGMRVGKGRVLPLRAKLQMETGGFADETAVKAAPQLRVHFVPESGAEVDRTDQIEVRDYGKGTSFVWDAEAHWKFDLGTLKFQQEGKYRAFLVSGDEGAYKVDPTCEVVFVLSGER
jgi:hypothetical protein